MPLRAHRSHSKAFSGGGSYYPTGYPLKALRMDSGAFYRREENYGKQTKNGKDD